MGATFRTSSVSFRLYVLFTAPVSLPPCPGSSTISPLQPTSCAATSGAKAIAARRPAMRAAARIDAHAFKELSSVISCSLLETAAHSLNPETCPLHPPDELYCRG